MRKIAYLTGEYPRATDTFIQREVAGVRAQGIEVLTCSIRRTGIEHLVGEEQREEAKNTFYVLSAAKSLPHFFRCHWRGFRRAPSRYFGGLKLAVRIRPAGIKALVYQLFYFAEAAVLADRLLASDVTHLHNHIAKASCTVAMITSKISGIPFSFTLHGPDIFFEPHHWRLDEKISQASFVSCISHFCRSQAMAFSPSEQWGKLHIVHCGVDPNRYGNDGNDGNDGNVGGGTGCNLLFVGRLAAVKGLPVLFDALERLQATHSDIRLTIVGDGPDREALEMRAKGLGEMVRFVGYKSQNEVAEMLGEADIFVLPSFAEGLPVVLMEALAARVPVVTTRIAGVAELVEDGVSGILVAPGDSAGLAGAIVRVLDNANLREKMGRAGRAKVIAEFDVARESAWLGQIIEAHHGTDSVGLRPEESGL